MQLVSAQELGSFGPYSVALRFDDSHLSVVGEAQPLPPLNRLGDGLVHFNTSCGFLGGEAHR